jgi:hypothetical protein
MERAQKGSLGTCQLMPLHGLCSASGQEKKVALEKENSTNHLQLLFGFTAIARDDVEGGTPK